MDKGTLKPTNIQSVIPWNNFPLENSPMAGIGIERGHIDHQAIHTWNYEIELVTHDKMILCCKCNKMSPSVVTVIAFFPALVNKRYTYIRHRG